MVLRPNHLLECQSCKRMRRTFHGGLNSRATVSQRLGDESAFNQPQFRATVLRTISLGWLHNLQLQGYEYS
jgi:hypothetical protein